MTPFSSSPSLVLAGADWWRAERTPTAARGSGGTELAFHALVAFTAILLLSPQAFLPVLKSVRIALLTALIAIAAHMLDRTARRRPVTPVRIEMAIVLLLAGWAIVTTPLSLWPGGSLIELSDRYLKAVAFFWMVATIVTSASRLRVFAWTLVLCSIPLATVGLYHFRSGMFLQSSIPGNFRIAGYTEGSGLTGNPNDLALMLNLIIPIAAALFFTTRNSLRAIAAGAILLSAAAVIVTFSRAGFITLAVTFVLGIVALARRQAPGPAAAIFAIALVTPFVLPQSYIARLNTITNISSDRTGSAQGRWEDWIAASELVTQHPITGVGIGQNILALNEVRGHTWRAVHNVYLEYAVDLGLPGALLFLWLFLACLNSARKVRARAIREPSLGELSILAEGTLVGLVAFGAAAFFYPVAYQFYFFCVAGLAVALKNVYRTECARLARTAPAAR